MPQNNSLTDFETRLATTRPLAHGELTFQDGTVFTSGWAQIINVDDPDGELAAVEHCKKMVMEICRKEYSGMAFDFKITRTEVEVPPKIIPFITGTSALRISVTATLVYLN